MTRDPAHEDTRGPGSLAWLVEIMARLLAPDGCPWDREQTLESLRPYLVEECYEVLEAIDAGDREQHCEELGDVLLQIVFQAALADLAMDRVIRTIGEKLIRRHPHVFGSVSVQDSAEVVRNWEAIKAAEKAGRPSSSESGPFKGIPRALPALQRAAQVVRRARKAGISDPGGLADAAALLDKLGLHDAEATPGARARAAAGAQHELIGELLLCIASFAAGAHVEPEQALRDALARYERRHDTRSGWVQEDLASTALGEGAEPR